jgi:hypothetical protein
VFFSEAGWVGVGTAVLGIFDSIGLIEFFFFQKKKQKALFRFAEGQGIRNSVKLTLVRKERKCFFLFSREYVLDNLKLVDLEDKLEI